MSVRDEAALICAVAASTRIFSYLHVAEGLGIDPHGGAARFAFLAWQAAVKANKRANRSAAWIDAEAEALIRTGWSP